MPELGIVTSIAHVWYVYPPRHCFQIDQAIDLLATSTSLARPKWATWRGALDEDPACRTVRARTIPKVLRSTKVFRASVVG